MASVTQDSAMRPFPRTTAFSLSVVNLVDDGLSTKNKIVVRHKQSCYVHAFDLNKYEKKISQQYFLYLQRTSIYTDEDAGFPTPLSATHLYSPRCDRSAVEIIRVFPTATVLPSLTLIQDSCTVGFPVALQYNVTFLFSFSIMMTFCGL